MLPMHRSSPNVAAILLDLLALVDTSEGTMTELAEQPPTSRVALTAALCPSDDFSTRATVSGLLDDLGLGEGVDKEAITSLLAELDLASQLEATIVARAPAPRSSLVVTATGSPELRHLQQALAFIPLFQLVEDVVRSTTNCCWLGAPTGTLQPSSACGQLFTELHTVAERWRSYVRHPPMPKLIFWRVWPEQSPTSPARAAVGACGSCPLDPRADNPYCYTPSSRSPTASSATSDRPT